MHGPLPLWLRVGQNSKEISFLNYVALKALGFIRYTNLEFLKLSDEGEGTVDISVQAGVWFLYAVKS